MKNIIITGGELFNKGAQAMTFVAVDEMKKRFPDHRILLLSEMDQQRPKIEKGQYAFEFTGWYPIKFAKCQSNILLKLLCLIKNRAELLEAEEIYNNTELMIDISGYALGSNWNMDYCNTYLDHLEFAKDFHIPIYLMPQSFGPFDFDNSVESQKLNQRIQDLLPTAKIIFAREQEGYDVLIKKYHLNNVKLAGDLVLNNKKINEENIYRKKISLTLPDIPKGCAAVIPNNRTLEVADSEKVMNWYITAIEKMQKEAPLIYIISHSAQDMSMCQKLKKQFEKDDRVILLDREFSCLEFEKLVQKFQYIFASRFHAIVHSFKSGTPCIVLGWATKYHELVKSFNQEQYMLDVRYQIENENITSIVEKMQKNSKDERLLILKKLSELQKENVFDLIQI